jgi:hypothetical protein
MKAGVLIRRHDTYILALWGFQAGGETSGE